MTKKKILISGAAGYLGSNICYFFSKLNYDLVCIDVDKNKLEILKKNYTNLKIKNFISPLIFLMKHK